MSEPTVRLEGVTKKFGEFVAVRDIDLDIAHRDHDGLGRRELGDLSVDQVQRLLGEQAVLPADPGPLLTGLARPPTVPPGPTAPRTRSRATSSWATSSGS